MILVSHAFGMQNSNERTVSLSGRFPSLRVVKKEGFITQHREDICVTEKANLNQSKGVTCVSANFFWRQWESPYSSRAAMTNKSFGCTQAAQILYDTERCWKGDWMGQCNEINLKSFVHERWESKRTLRQLLKLLMQETG